MRPAPQTPALNQTADLFAPSAPLATAAAPAYDLDAAHADYARQRASRSRWRSWLGLLIALLAVNAALWFRYTQSRGVLGSQADTAPQPPIAESKIMPYIGPAPAPAPTAAASLPVAAPAPAAASTDKTLCQLWEFSSNAELKRADNRLAEQAWSGYQGELAQEPATYMVFLGPFESKTDLASKVKVLAKMKIDDYSQLPTGLISLGVLATAEAANKLKQSLTKRGLQGVQVQARTGSAQRTRYRFEGLSTDSASALVTLAAGVGSLRSCE